MNKWTRLGLLIPLLSSYVSSQITPVLEYFQTVLQQPEYVLPIKAYNRIASNYYLSGIPKAEYPAALLDADTIQKIITLAQATYADLPSKKWLNEKCPTFERKEKNGYIQKVLIPQGSRIIFFGDLHGSMQALVRILCKLIALGYLDKNLHLKENIYLVFLGDLVDYGHNGIDTLCTALYLRTTNPNQVLLCRGNHEDKKLNEDQSRNHFAEEVSRRYPNSRNKILNQVYDFYEYLPSAIFLGIADEPITGFIQCCHGGLSQEATNEVKQLLAIKDNATASPFYATLPEEAFFSIGGNCATNFNWADFTGSTDAPDVGLSSRDGKSGFFKVFSMNGAQKIMGQLNIQALFRGHQDQFDCCKFLTRGIDSPIYPFSSAISMVGAPKRNRFKTIIQTFIPSALELFEQGFLLGELPTDANGWIVAPIFTFTNASAPRFNDSEGCGILTVGTTWQKSRLQVYAATTPIMHFRHAVVGNVNTNKLVKSIFPGDKTAQTKALDQTDDFLQAFRAFLLIPSLTHIDENGQALIFANTMPQYQKFFRGNKPFFDNLLSKFGLPDNITPGISTNL